MKIIQNVAIFCGSSEGKKSIYADAARELAVALCRNDLSIVFGGAKIGLMGVIADAVLKESGRAIGVIPKSLIDVEIAHENLTHLHIVNSMSERKVLIDELSDAYVLLPGGAGSLDEFFNILTAAQLGYHKKPCAILNINHY